MTGSSPFDRGIESALQFILASPEFLFRVESDPPNLAPSTLIGWMMWRWPRGCRSFSGAVFRTTSC